jgi:uncharacterized SAM-dependent methyltransferase
VPPPAGRRLALFLGSTIGNLMGRPATTCSSNAALPTPATTSARVDLVKDVRTSGGLQRRRRGHGSSTAAS